MCIERFEPIRTVEELTTDLIRAVLGDDTVTKRQFLLAWRLDGCRGLGWDALDRPVVWTSDGHRLTIRRPGPSIHCRLSFGVDPDRPPRHSWIVQGDQIGGDPAVA